MKLYNVLQPPSLQKQDQRIHWGNLSGSSAALAVSCLATQSAQGPLLVITPDIQTGRQFEREFRFFTADENVPCYYFPDWETLPYDQFSPHSDLISERLFTLYQLSHLTKGLVVVSLATLMHRLLPREYLLTHSLFLTCKERLNLQVLRQQLIQAGYRAVTQVFEHGEFAIRGAILDIYPMGSPLPYRIELFDEEIESIRQFDPDTQRSQKTIEKIRLLPAREYPLTESGIQEFRQNWRSLFTGNPKESPIYESISLGEAASGAEYYLPLFFPHLNTLFNYLPINTQIICMAQLPTLAEKLWQEFNNRYEQLRYDIKRPVCEPPTIFIPPTEFFTHMKQFPQIQCHEEILPEKTGNYSFATNPPPSLPLEHKAQKPLFRLEEFLEAHSERILFCAETTGRREILLELLSNINVNPQIFSTWKEFLHSTVREGICVAALDKGLWLQQPPISMLCESQLFGEQVMQRRLRTQRYQDPNTLIRNLTELQIGAPVVHFNHGVGKYLGLEQIRTGNQEDEYLKLEYADGDKIYVPVTSLHLISRYTGADSDHAPLQKLGSKQWQALKRKTAQQVRDVAAELLDIYSRRQANPGHAFKKPDQNFLLFRRAFPFEETPDQTKTIDAVIEDMIAPRCMDRLVCGDVGFGKTEVAMQAAFLAVQDGKQVAILVPTTLLAEQHLHSFQDRFADWPVNIATFSRLRSAKEQKESLERLKSGKLDIAIGTHKLLSPAVKFKDLGLLIIDEEHRFGVQQKERIKSLRTHVDILTLTATPIPRTLNMALAGTRDLSIIATPPARRLSIKTFVYPYEPSTIREAVLREAMRGGQLYFLHNEVETIEATAKKLQEYVPEARIGIAHGQMPESRLEKVMADFYHQRFNLLVCTTIIESGIDIPTANTIIINRADRFGLAQLHQLRGRVGRSHHQAYAYLLILPEKKLTADAEKRLEAIAQLEGLGAGFQLATHDLEIRGAGELLGAEQSGHIQAVGFSLYMEMLEAAVQSLKSGQEPSLEPTIQQGIEINLHLSAFIPENYVPDVHSRLTIYKRLANCETSSQIQDLKAELVDRFGLLPEVTQQLFAIAQLKLRAISLGIQKIEIIGQYGYLHFVEKPHIDPKKIVALIQKQSKNYQLQGGTILRFRLQTEETNQRIRLVHQVLDALI